MGTALFVLGVTRLQLGALKRTDSRDSLGFTHAVPEELMLLLRCVDASPFDEFM
jgi:hypothetical protein